MAGGCLNVQALRMIEQRLDAMLQAVAVAEYTVRVSGLSNESITFKVCSKPDYSAAYFVFLSHPNEYYICRNKLGIEDFFRFARMGADYQILHDEKNVTLNTVRPGVTKTVRFVKDV